jgi:hypothetical protein
MPPGTFCFALTAALLVRIGEQQSVPVNAKFRNLCRVRMRRAYRLRHGSFFRIRTSAGQEPADLYSIEWQGAAPRYMSTLGVESEQVGAASSLFPLSARSASSGTPCRAAQCATRAPNSFLQRVARRSLRFTRTRVLRPGRLASSAYDKRLAGTR